jgi:hypothetical protein
MCDVRGERTTHDFNHRRLVVFRTLRPARDAIPDSDGFTLADFYPFAGVVSIATYLVVECLLG